MYLGYVPTGRFVALKSRIQQAERLMYWSGLWWSARIIHP